MALSCGAMADITPNSVDLKLARAAEHGYDLRDEVRRWVEDDPYRIVVKTNADRTEWTMEVGDHPIPPFDRWSILFGDAVHNTRCALDHFFFALAHRYAPKSDIYRRFFPVTYGEKGWNTWMKARKDELWLAFPSAVQAAIEREQPYNRKNGGGNGFLGMLHALDTTDKHHTLNMVIVPSREVFWTNLRTDFLHPWSSEWTGPVTFGPEGVKKGHELGRVTFKYPPKVDPNPHVKVAVGIPNPTEGQNPFDINGLLDTLRQEVVEVIGRIETVAI